MIIQLNTDHNIDGNLELEAYVNDSIDRKLGRFSDRLSRIEVHFKDTNGDKSGIRDKHCTLEARIKGRKPTAVTNEAPTVELALQGAVEKLKTHLDNVLHG